MCTFYYIIQFPALVFQKSTIIPFSQRAKENTKKSGSLNYGGFLYITIMRS